MTKFGKRIERLEKQLPVLEEAADQPWIALGDGPARPMKELARFELTVVSRLGEWVNRGEAAPAVTYGRQHGHPVARINITLDQMLQLADDAEAKGG